MKYSQNTHPPANGDANELRKAGDKSEAQLLDATSDLLMACQALIAYDEMIEDADPRDFEGYYRAVIKMAQAAIDKATRGAS